MKIKTVALIASVLFYVMPVFALEQTITILHTNDLHSHFLGFSPNNDYSPETIGDDKTRGGWARLATAIKAEKEKRDHPVLVLDGGDYLMGSLFHMVSREEALELKLMGEMGYDVVTLGNHEFDLKPIGLARILESVLKNNKRPKIVASNLIFSSADDRDNRLEELFYQGVIQEYLITEQEGLRIGLFGLIGKDAAEVAPFASPVRFADPLERAEKTVRKLRDLEKVDLVICLSHSGLAEILEDSEDVALAKAVPGIDVIVSGHTHTKVEKPIIVNDTVIVQSGDYGLYLGVLDLTYNQGEIAVKSYKLVPIDDSIEGDSNINKMVQSAIKQIDQQVLSEMNLSFGQNLIETEFDLLYKNDESNLGNLITDAIRWGVDQAEYDPTDPSSRVQLAIQSNGVIRDSLFKGEKGLISVSDLFRVVPLGIGLDDTMGYPLISFYVNGPEIKKTMEILTTIYPLKGSDYFLQFSGAKIKYNLNRMLFDRVTEIYLEQEDGSFKILDSSESNPALYKITSNFYNSTFLKIIGGFTNEILTIIPKDRFGNPIDDLAKYKVDVDRYKEGVQELKDWTALMGYVQTFVDTDGNGIGNMPEKYRNPEGRQTKMDSLNPYSLLKGGNYLTWIAFLILVLMIAVLSLIIYFMMRFFRKRKAVLAI